MEQFDFFSELDKKELEILKSKSKYVEISKGTILFYEGDICKDILYLIDGNVKLSISTAGSDEIPLYDFCQGEQCIVNIASTLSETKAVATAEASSDIKGWLIPKEVIQELMIHSPAYQKFIFSLFTIRFSALTTLVEDIKFKRLDSRILDFLHSYESKIVKITHEEIANHLGTSRVVISRVLKDLKDKKYIELKRGKILVLK